MDDQKNDLIMELISKTAKIECQLDSHKELLEKIDTKLTPIVTTVQHHSTIIKGWSWFIGVIISIFTAKYMGKF